VPESAGGCPWGVVWCRAQRQGAAR